MPLVSKTESKQASTNNANGTTSLYDKKTIKLDNFLLQHSPQIFLPRITHCFLHGFYYLTEFI